MTEEAWKDILGYNCYQISNRGNVRKILPNGEFRPIKPYQHHDKFLKVELWKDGKRKKMFVHRLVKDTFNLTFTLAPTDIEEEWRDIPGYEGYYRISNFGRVLRLSRGKQWPYRQTHNNIRKPRLRENGYLAINLSKDNKVKWYLLHRLVALTFISNPNNLPCVNHKDENRQNNFVGNLEWCSQQYNVNYGTAIERSIETRKNLPNKDDINKRIGEKNSKKIRCFKPNGLLYGVYNSLTEASRETGVHISQISRHCNGHVGNDKNRPIRKFRFEYAV